MSETSIVKKSNSAEWKKIIENEVNHDKGECQLF
jgi:hypothetical protein